MKLNFMLFFSILISGCAFGQTTDSTTTPRSFNSFKGIKPGAGSIIDSKRQEQIIYKGNIGIKTTNLQLTKIESEISDMESLECKALLQRDTAALKNIWLRDFTLDGPQNKIHIGQNPIPYYVSLTRIIERFTILENIVYTSGQEYVKLMGSDGKLEEPITQEFFHVWTKKLSGWKLSEKTHEK